MSTFSTPARQSVMKEAKRDLTASVVDTGSLEPSLSQLELSHDSEEYRNMRAAMERGDLKEILRLSRTLSKSFLIDYQELRWLSILRFMRRTPHDSLTEEQKKRKAELIEERIKLEMAAEKVLQRVFEVVWEAEADSRRSSRSSIIPDLSSPAKFFREEQLYRPGSRSDDASRRLQSYASGNEEGEPVDEHPENENLYYKVCAVVGNNYFSVFDGETEYKLGVTLRQKIVHPTKKCGFFVFNSLEQALRCPFPSHSKLLYTPRVLLLVHATGNSRTYKNGCFAFECITPVQVLCRLVRNGKHSRAVV